MLEMLKMQYVVVMAMTLMGIVCGSNLHMVGVDIPPLQIAIVVMVVVGVDAECQGALIIAYWSQDYPLQLHGKISRITCGVLGMFVSLKSSVMVVAQLE